MTSPPSPAPPGIPTTAPPRTGRPRRRRRSRRRPRAGHEQVVFCHDAETGLRADHRPLLHRARARLWAARGSPYASRRTPPSRTSSTSPADGLQERARRAGPRRRQGRDHRRPGDGQDRGAAARLRPLRASRSAAATSPPATSAPTWRTWTSSRGRAAGSPAAARPRRRRRLLRADRARRVPGHARRRADTAGDRRRSRAAASASPGWARWAGTWCRPAPRGRRRRRRHRRRRRRRRAGCSPSTPACGGRLDTDVLVARGARRVRALRARRRADAEVVPDAARGDRLRRREQPARRTPGSPSCWPPAASSTRPDYCVNAGGVIQVADELHGFSFERARARRGGSSTRRSPSCARRPSTATRPPRPRTGWPSARMREIGGLSRIHLRLTPPRSAHRRGLPPRAGPARWCHLAAGMPRRPRTLYRCLHERRMTKIRGPAVGACPGSTYEGVDAMGRGRAKAKQTKVARELKYFSPTPTTTPSSGSSPQAG